MKYKLLPAAETDLTESMEWYVIEKSGLEVEFLKEVEHTFNQLSKKPFLYAVRHKRKAVQLRAAAMNRFPFLVVFFVDLKRHLVIITAVWHTSRDPEVWKKRAP